MATLSLRQIVQDTFGPTDLSGGFRHELFSAFYQIHPSAFPFKNGSAQSVKQVLKHWDTWPAASDFSQETDYPENASTSYGNSIQGMSHTQNYWVFSRRDRRVTFRPVFLDLESQPSTLTETTYALTVSNTQLPEAYNHFGDCDAKYIPEADRWLVIDALEGNGVPNAFGFISFEDDTLNVGSAGPTYLGRWNISGSSPQGPLIDEDNPWSVFDPRQKLIYSSDFNPNALYVYAYDNEYGVSDLQVPSLSYLASLALLDRSGASTSFERVQGGSFTPNHRLFLSIDLKLEDNGGIYGVDLATGRVLLYLPSKGSNGNTAVFGGDYNHEIQGMTVWNVDPMNSPSVSGQLHVPVRDYEFVGGDDITIRHWSINASKISNL